MMKASATFCILYMGMVFALAGCDNLFKPTKLDIEKVIKLDPSFKQTLDKKEELDNQIASVLSEFYAYKDEIDSKMSAIKKEYRDKKQEVNIALDNLKSSLDPERDEIKKNTASLNNELKIKNQELSSIKSRLSTLYNMLNDKEAEITQETKKKWQDEAEELQLKEAPLKEEVVRLKDSIRLLSQELVLLKQ